MTYIKQMCSASGEDEIAVESGKIIEENKGFVFVKEKEFIYYEKAVEEFEKNNEEFCTVKESYTLGLHAFDWIIKKANELRKRMLEVADKIHVEVWNDFGYADNVSDFYADSSGDVYEQRLESYTDAFVDYSKYNALSEEEDGFLLPEFKFHYPDDVDDLKMDTKEFNEYDEKMCQCYDELKNMSGVLALMGIALCWDKDAETHVIRRCKKELVLIPPSVLEQDPNDFIC